MKFKEPLTTSKSKSKTVSSSESLEAVNNFTVEAGFKTLIFKVPSPSLGVRVIVPSEATSSFEVASSLAVTCITEPLGIVILATVPFVKVIALFAISNFTVPLRLIGKADNVPTVRLMPLSSPGATVIKPLLLERVMLELSGAVIVSGT